MRFLISRASQGLHEDRSPDKNAFRFGGEWVIDFDSLDELMEFIDRVGQCVISQESRERSILIYDDWLE